MQEFNLMITLVQYIELEVHHYVPIDYNTVYMLHWLWYYTTVLQTKYLCIYLTENFHLFQTCKAAGKEQVQGSRGVLFAVKP